MITFIVAPESAPQTFVPALHGVEHPLAMEVVTAMHERGHQPVPLWKLIDGLAEARRPPQRDQRRCLCLRFWGAIRELLRAKVLFRHNGMVATKDFAFTPKPRSGRRLSLDVGIGVLEIEYEMAQVKKFYRKAGVLRD